MKRLITFMFVICLGVLLTACGEKDTTSADGKSVKATILKVAFNQGEDHPQYVALKDFGEKLEKRTEGAYKLELYPNETLGAQREAMELTQSGTIAMSVVAGGLLENLNEDFSVLNLPYVFTSKEHQMSVLQNKDIVGELFDSLKGQGLIIAGAFHSGERNIYNSKKAVNTPADLKGMKIRVIESDTNIKMLAAMGGTGTPMGQGEVYTAIQSGVIDGGENNELIFANMKHSEVAPYYSYTRHLMFPDYVLVNTKIFDGMSETQQTIFKDEMAAAVSKEVELWSAEVEKATATAKSAGAKFNEVDVESFKSATQGVVDSKLNSDTAKELYKKVQEAAK
ncbi:TRAP transporter substrate-binding protein [Kurthia sibirica]|uniref:C4-dicarboxylate ABC transporter substrate-binding protein n=1 Tax=Kurthia sibirica TaxID=202750 RepID=A0A2U3AI35_9BACL|nr:TRAP transporter substrate-binding protein [Kurthia sibirica]PWI24195.1 C4-dicarboxylate ABC transporter substrate-binding protein [Kurthia sibirica]GEK34815.1 C4-dicarboxylate ABC transporter substrate-binding protein [Kurthia sibirica]